MIETNIENVSVEAIMAGIKKSAQRRKNANHIVAGNQDNIDIQETSSINLNFPFENIFTNKSQYEVDDFNQYHDITFITNVYRGLLKREPDKEGMQTYLEQLRSGKQTKTEILTTIRFSEEGKSNNVKILGIKKRYWLTVIFRLPFIGYLAKSISALLTLPQIVKRLNQYENHFSMLYEVSKNNDLLLQNAVNKKIERSELENKADKPQIEILKENLTSALNSKADQSAVEKTIATMQKKLHAKAEQNEITRTIASIQEALHSKVDRESDNEENHKLDAMYVAFEDRFRGTTEDIKERISIYLPYVQEARKATKNAPVLDIACGRGEWLSLMQENDIQAKGIDINQAMLSQCQDKGLNVIETDVITYLKNQKSNSLSVITGFHIIEHLSFKVVMSLYDEVFRVLKPGGTVIFETPNPENLVVGACNFYLDPTHINPIPPETSKFFLEQSHFINVEIKRLHWNKDQSSTNDESPLSVYFNQSQDYSIIGHKRK